jgi:hypothetical protein
MSRFSGLSVIAAIACTVSVAAAQFAPPTPVGDSSGGVSNPAVSGAAPAVSVESPIPITTQDAQQESSFFAIRANQPMTTNALIGFVNSEPIFVADLFAPIDDNLRRIWANSRSVVEFKTGAAPVIKNQLDHLVDQTLVITDAQKSMTEEDKTRIEFFMNKQQHDLLSTYGGSVPAADKALRAKGTTYDKVLSDMRKEDTYELYMIKNIRPHVVVTRQMVLDAYNKDPKAWQEPATVELYTLTLPVVRWLREPTTDGTKGPVIAHPTAAQVAAAEGQAMATANEIIGKLKGGADFAKLVEDYDSRDVAASRGGRTPNLHIGALLNTRMEKYVFSLPANTIGEPQLFREKNPADSSVVVVKIGDKAEARVVPFEEAQTQIRKALENQQLAELMRDHVLKLQTNAAIEAIDRMTDVALEAAVTRYGAK